MADPLNNVSKRKDERKIKSDARKAGREAKRESMASDIVSKEAGRYGIDLDDLTTRPIGDAAKRRITEGVSQATSAEKWGVTDKIAGFQKAAPGPVLEDRPSLDEKALKESARKQRRSAWVDALTAFGQGVTTGRVDPESLRSTKFKRERDIEFQTYRDITERNKQTRNLWEHQNRNELLNFVNKQIEDEKVDKADKIKYQQIADQITTKNLQWEKEFGLKQRRQTLSEDQLKAKIKGTYYAPKGTPKTEKDLENDAAYQLKKKQHLLDIRQQEGKEAAEKLTNTLKGFEAEINNLFIEKTDLEDAKEDLGWGNKTEKANYDALISEIDAKIAAANKNIETSLKGYTSGTSQEKLDDFFGEAKE